MNRHPRIPAVLALLLFAAAGFIFLAAAGQFRQTDLAHASIDELERKIVGSTDGRVWSAYGDKLREAGKFASAAKAYQRAIELQPDLQEAQMNAGVALGQAGDADGFFNYVSRLVLMYPKAAVDLLDRPELTPLHADSRWEATTAAAKAQAMD